MNFAAVLCQCNWCMQFEWNSWVCFATKLCLEHFHLFQYLFYFVIHSCAIHISSRKPMWRNRVAAIQQIRSELRNIIFSAKFKMPYDTPYSFELEILGSVHCSIGYTTETAGKCMQNGHFNLKICYKMLMRGIIVNFWKWNSRTENNYSKWCSILVSSTKNGTGKMLSQRSGWTNEFFMWQYGVCRTHTHTHNVAARHIHFSHTFLSSLFEWVFAAPIRKMTTRNWWKKDARIYESHNNNIVHESRELFIPTVRIVGRWISKCVAGDWWNRNDRYSCNAYVRIQTESFRFFFSGVVVLAWPLSIFGFFIYCHGEKNRKTFALVQPATSQCACS